MTRMRRLSCLLIPALFICVVLALLVSTGGDDSHLTYWAAYSLWKHGRVLNYNLASVEQSTSLLHVVLLAATSFISTLRPDQVAVPFSMAFGAVTTLFLNSFPSKVGAPRWLPGLLLCFYFPFLYWSASGLETSLAAVSLLAFTYYSNTFLSNGTSKTPLAASAIATLLVRPEFVIIPVSVAIVVAFAFGKDERRRSFVLLALIIVCTVAIALLRLRAFSQIAPEPVYAKARPFDLIGGFSYYRTSWALTWPLLAAFLFWMFQRAKSIKNADILDVTIATTILSYFTFILLIGGDWMPVGRFFMPLIPLMLLAVRDLCVKRPSQGVALICTAATFILALVVHRPTALWLQPQVLQKTTDLSDYSIWDRANLGHVRDMRAADTLSNLVAELLKHQASVTVLSGQMGFISYTLARRFEGRVHFLDPHGLVDRASWLEPLNRRIAHTEIGFDYEVNDFMLDLPTFEKAGPLPDLVFHIRKPEWTRYCNRYILLLPNDVPTYGGNYIAIRSDLENQVRAVNLRSIYIGPALTGSVSRQ